MNRDFIVFFRKRWFEFEELDNHDYYFTPENNPTAMQHADIINPSIQLCKNVQLTVTCRFSQSHSNLLIHKINSVLATVKITCLDIDCSKILITTFIKLIDHLPHLDSLRISYLPLPESRCFIPRIIENMPVPQKNEKITKVNIEHMFRLEQIHFLIDLCPSIQYLIISYVDDVYFILHLRLFLKSCRYLILLTLNFSSANDEMIERIQIMMNQEYYYNHTIERTNNQIFLRRKLV